MSKKKSLSARWRELKDQDLSANIFRAGRWMIYFVGIGIIAGLGSIAFHYLTQLGVHFFLDAIAGYRPPAPAGEHHLLPATSREFSR